MLLNNQQIIEEIKKEIKICIEMNENENTTTQNLWDTIKAVLRGRFIALQAYLKKQEKSQILKTQQKGNSTIADKELWSIFINFLMLHQHFNILWKTRLPFSIY